MLSAILDSIHPTKAPSPDGMPALFYQKYWDIVGHAVIIAIQNIFTHRIFPQGLNDSFIVLIPKSAQLSSFNKIRPIALCNTLYKVVSKIFVSWLRPLLHNLISPNQIAFILGRWIGENSILVKEIIHSMKNKKGIKSFVGIKIDFQNAYDRVNLQVFFKSLVPLV